MNLSAEFTHSQVDESKETSKSISLYPLFTSALYRQKLIFDNVYSDNFENKIPRTSKTSKSHSSAKFSHIFHT